MSRASIQTSEVELSRLDEEIDESEFEAEVSQSRSRIAAAGIAVVLHLILGLAATLVIVATSENEAPPIVVVSDNAEPTRPVSRPLMERTRREPSQSSRRPVPALSAAASSAVALPTTDLADGTALDMGSGLGDALGFGHAAFGPGAGAQFLGLRGSGNRIVLVIDVSGSMIGNCGPRGLAAIKTEVARTVNSFNAQTMFNIMTFAGDVDAFRGGLVRATPENKSAAIAFFDAYYENKGFSETRTDRFGRAGEDSNGIRYVPIESSDFGSLRGLEGSTRVELGVVAALANRPSTVFIISDGDPQTRRGGSRLDHADLLEIIKDEHDRLSPRERVMISTISVEGLGARFLRRVASTFGGHYKSIKPAEL